MDIFKNYKYKKYKYYLGEGVNDKYNLVLQIDNIHFIVCSFSHIPTQKECLKKLDNYKYKKIWKLKENSNGN